MEQEYGKRLERNGRPFPLYFMLHREWREGALLEERGLFPRFSRSFDDRELEEVQNFLLVIQEKRLFLTMRRRCL